MPRDVNRDRSSKNREVKGKIKRASDYTDNATFLIYGRAKSGKTRLAASAPKVLIIDVNEKGTRSVARDINPNVIRVERWVEVDDIYWYLQSGNHQFESVAIDGVTAMQTLCMNFLLGEAHALDASRDPEMPRGPLWQKLSVMMKTQITNYRNLPMNVIFTALTRDRIEGDDDDMEGERVTGPACSPSVSGHLEAAVDLIGFLTKREVVVKTKGGKKRKVMRTRLIVDGTERYLVGDRTHTFGTHVDAPNLTEMLKAMKGAE